MRPGLAAGDRDSRAGCRARTTPAAGPPRATPATPSSSAPTTKAEPAGHGRRLQGRALHRRRRPRLRLLRHDAALPDQPDRRREPASTCSTCPTRRNPVLTDKLVTPAMLSPHESLVVSQERGRARRRARQPGLLPGHRRRLRHLPGLPPPGAEVQRARSASSATRAAWRPTAAPSTRPRRAARRWSPSTSPTSPRRCRSGSGPTTPTASRSATTATAPTSPAIDSGLIILDTSEIQARVPNPQVREIARLTWDSMSIPQNAIPVTIDGHPYLVEIDEFGTLDEVGAGRIIDIGDETKPQVISNLRLEVHQPENFDADAGDPGAGNPLQGYAGHYCNVPTRVDPGIVACSMILSGLRVFDIRDPRHPREIAYFNAPIEPAPDAGLRGQQLGDVEPVVRRPSAARSGTPTAYSGFFAVRAHQRRLAVPEVHAKDGDAAARSPRRPQRRRDRRRANPRPDRDPRRQGSDLRQGQARPRKRRRRQGPGQGRRRPRQVARRQGQRPARRWAGRDTLGCGPGRRDVAIAGRRDRVRGCERDSPAR